MATATYAGDRSRTPKPPAAAPAPFDPTAPQPVLRPQDEYQRYATTWADWDDNRFNDYYNAAHEYAGRSGFWGGLADQFRPQLPALEFDKWNRARTAWLATQTPKPEETYYGQNTTPGQPPAQQAPYTGGGGGGGGFEPSSYLAQFSDPGSAQLEGYSQEWLKTLAGMRQQQETDNARFREQQAAAQQATERLIAFMNQRIGTLGQPAYTGAEGEIMRTRALDPIENDRQASQKRALERISARGMDQTSGLALGAANDVDAYYDRFRAEAQNNLGYRQVEEQRSREQEAQNLLGLIPSLQRAGAAGDLNFINQMNASLNGLFQQGMTPATMLYDMPRNALNDALAVMGMGPSGGSLFNQYGSLWNMQNQQQQQGANGWYAFGRALGLW